MHSLAFRRTSRVTWCCGTSATSWQGSAIRLGRLSLHRRRLRRLPGALGRRDQRHAADLGAQPAPRAGGAGLARLRQGCGKRVEVFRLAGIYGPGRASSNLAGRYGQAHRQAGPGVQPHPCRRRRPRAGGGHRQGRGAQHLQRQRRRAGPAADVVAYAAELMGLPVPPEVAFETAKVTGMAASFSISASAVGNARIKADLGVELMYPTYREGLKGALV